MKKIILFSILFCQIAYATVEKPLINTITLQLEAHSWVKIESALVNVTFDAISPEANIAELQAAMFKKLAILAPAEGLWHIIQLNRQLDKSGLENIQIVAQARLPQSQLFNLHAKAKKISQPGQTFSITSIEFTPSEENLRQGYADLREDIYQQTQSEIKRLAKIDTKNTYFIHQINFLNAQEPKRLWQANAMPQLLKMANPAEAPMAVDNKIYQNALVVLGTIPSPLSNK